MIEILNQLENIEDIRQQYKVKHSLKDIVGIVLIATLGNANEWTEIEIFAKEHEDFLREYFELKNGIPSHDTISRVMGFIEPKVIQDMYSKWNEYVSQGEGERIKKILNIDGKTMRGSSNINKKALHVLTVWSDEDGIGLGQKLVDDKTNEITMIPDLLDEISIKDSIITMDAMGTQVKIAEKIISKKGSYVLAVKGNQGNLFEEIKTYFEDEEFLKSMKKSKNYKRTVEKNRSQIEKREYYQTEDIKWMQEKKKWKKIKSIGMVQNTIEKDGKISIDRRYYISSESVDIELFAKCCRGHWAIESMHWHLDVTFKEDSSKILDKIGNQNLNIIRKWALSILKTLDISDKKCSLKSKRFRISINPKKYLKDMIEM